jgi:hypothetical protein
MENDSIIHTQAFNYVQFLWLNCYPCLWDYIQNYIVLYAILWRFYKHTLSNVIYEN